MSEANNYACGHDDCWKAKRCLRTGFGGLHCWEDAGRMLLAISEFSDKELRQECRRRQAIAHGQSEGETK